eukprot:5824655-Pleurochrysis_carterae.AAC.1
MSCNLFPLLQERLVGGDDVCGVHRSPIRLALRLDPREGQTRLSDSAAVCTTFRARRFEVGCGRGD